MDLPALGLLGRYIAVCDEDQRWVAVTDDLAALIGYRVRDLIGVSAWDVAADSSPERREAVTGTLFGDGVIHGTSAFKTRSNGVVPGFYTARTLNGGSFYVCHFELAAPMAAEVAASAERTLARSSHSDATDQWMTKEEAATYTRCSSSKIDRAVRGGFLRAGGSPRLRLYRRNWLDDWVADGAQG